MVKLELYLSIYLGVLYLQEVHLAEAPPDPPLQRLQQVCLPDGPPLSLDRPLRRYFLARRLLVATCLLVVARDCFLVAECVNSQLTVLAYL